MTEKSFSRFAEVDILRGVAVAIMIIVDASPGDTYQALEHAAWEGITFADMAFPGFVFAMGVSVAISISRRKINLQKVFKRSVILFLLGIFFNALPFIFAIFLWQEFTSADFFSWTIENGRIFGILQRLALTYLLGNLVIKFFQSDRKILFASFGFLILSSLGFHLYAPENSFEVGKNIFDAADLFLLGGNHLYTPNHDPEGLYGTLSSTAEFLFGFLAGKLFLRKDIGYLISASIILFSAGIFWSMFDIISKNLWTSPFTLLTSGIEIFLLVLTIKFFGIKFLKPFEWLGKNPLLFFVASYVGLVFLLVLRIENISAWHWIFQNTLQGFVSSKFSAVLVCFIWIGIWIGIWIFIAKILDRKNIFIKI